ncbi:hypothetical protein E4U41_000216 [Claviceps citrina]|nr:hypothetical protein E4U41_000216 [Claviceps citrina]
MLATRSPVWIALWLFFPVHVALIRRLVQRLLLLATTTTTTTSTTSTTSTTTMLGSPSAPPPNTTTVHLESHRGSALAVYALPVLASALAHGFVIAAAVTGPDDRREMTRSAVKFIEIEFQYLALTVLYWLLAEVGWRAPLAMTAASAVLGPGAGVALAWLYRERLIVPPLGGGGAGGEDEEAGAEGEGEDGEGEGGEERGRGGDDGPDERTPLVS